LNCFEDYFGTNCLVPKEKEQYIFPIVNCIEQVNNNNYIYIGYANTKSYETFPSNSIGDNTFKCGNNIINIPISAFQYGQFNFVYKVECNENITWSINGSVLILSQGDLMSRMCNTQSYQKFMLIDPSQYSFSTSQIETILLNFAQIANINPSRINITQRPNEINQIKDGELIFSITNSTGTEPAHSTVIYNFSKNKNLKALFANTNINFDEVTMEILTFNETVGTKSGCFMKGINGNSSLVLGNIVNCYTSSTSNQPIFSDISPVLIGVVVGIVSTIIIISVILLLIPRIRAGLFRNQVVPTEELK